MGAHCTHTMKRVQLLQFASFFLRSVKIQIARGYKKLQPALPAP
jgi:hypothetical protein